MHNLGMLLIVAAFLAGAYLTSLDHSHVDWMYFLPTLLLGFVGLALFKRQARQAARADGRLNEDIEIMAGCLNRISAQLAQLAAKKDELPTYEARFEIDRLFREDLDRFADVRTSMQHKFGLREYANIMSAFAAGERYINRVWSASTDGYVDEVKQYLERAATQFAEAQALFERARAQQPQG